MIFRIKILIEETGVGKRLLKCENTKQATWNLWIEWSERILCLEKRGLEVQGHPTTVSSYTH